MASRSVTARRPRTRAGWASRARRIRQGVFLALLAVAVVGPWIVPYDPLRPDPFAPLSPPSAEHWFGTNHLGMDVFSRVIAAARVDFSLALLGVLIGGGLGSVMGAWAAYRRGWADVVLLRVVEVLQSFPVLLFGIMLFAVLGGGYVVLIAAIASVNFPLYLRQVRSVLIPLTDVGYVQAAKCGGLGGWGVVWHHFLPNARGQILALFALTCAYAIQIIAGLSFIGLGVEPPNPEWGSMINAGASLIMQGAWWPSLFPGLAIVLSVYSLTGFSRDAVRPLGPAGGTL